MENRENLLTLMFSPKVEIVCVNRSETFISGSLIYVCSRRQDS